MQLLAVSKEKTEQFNSPY